MLHKGDFYSKKALKPLHIKDFKAFWLARCKGFEPLTFWFVAIIKQSIINDYTVRGTLIFMCKFITNFESDFLKVLWQIRFLIALYVYIYFA